MKRIGISLSCGLILAALAACPSASPGVDPGPIVYVAGYYNDGTNVRAAYWKDNGNTITRVDLDDLVNASDSEASDIFVDANGIVYLSGYYDYNSAVYWTDDAGSVVQHDLPVAGNSKATGIVVDADGIVCISGYDYSTNDIAVYWTIDGGAIAKHVLHDLTAAHATGIYVDGGGIVYASGDRAGPVAVYWSDDQNLPVVETDIHTGTSYANAIAVDGTGAYVAGTYAPVVPPVAAYWTGGAWENLTSVAGNAWDIVRYGGQVYSVGDYTLSGPPPGRRAAYWSGTTKTDLDGNLSNTYAYGIYIFDGDVYSAGAQIEDNTTSDTEAIYWRNDAVVDLSAGVGSRANAIFVR